MKSHGGATAVSHHPKKPKSREVSPRFLSPASSTTSSSTDYGSHESPTSILSPIKQQKPRSSTDSRKPKTLKNSGFLRGLWPSSSVPSLPKKPDTLADFIGNEQREELAERKVKKKSDQNPSILNRQRSCTEFSRFDNDRNNIASKENFNPIFGGSMRYTGKFKFPGKSKSSNLMESEDDILPGRFSIDEIAVRKNSYSRGLLDPDSGSEYSDCGPSFDSGKDSPASYMAPTVSSRKHRIDVPSRFMQDNLSSRSRRWSGDPLDHYGNNSPKIFSLTKKGSGDWASSPARTGSPKVPFGENKGKLTTMINSKPPSSPSRGKGVGNILSLGIELLKGKKSTSSSSTSPLGPGSVENVHQLKLLHNSLTQWRFSNAKAEAVDENIVKQAEVKSIHVWNALIKLQQSVLQKKLQLQKEKLKMKLDYIVHSQIKALEAWGNMERQHSSAVCSTTDYLHSVICRIPLVDGAKVEPQSASVVCHASDLATKINMMITSFQPTVEKTVGVVAELAMVVIQEKQLLEECLDLFKYVSALEMEERSLRGSIMQLRLLEQQQLEIMA
ncbi:hypothetical protein C2S53_008681 [Perilla frutescens var. hirtella]|uniref:QWRF motif-containing protein 3 n=1 Tax=Perilla frutescens var. hirtella TaxID=608512 RepID=A0AAD4J1Q2_PERFH|nr:hypothetical protein C2S53_008681 [Perilla frutescens var. hirtella]